MGTGSCGGIMYRAKQTVVDCSTCEVFLSSPFLSLSDFTACRFILQLLSNRLACVSVECVLQNKRRDVGERKSSTYSASLSVRGMVGWSLNISDLISSRTSSFSQYYGNCCCFRSLKNKSAVHMNITTGFACCNCPSCS